MNDSDDEDEYYDEEEDDNQDYAQPQEIQQKLNGKANNSDQSKWLRQYLSFWCRIQKQKTFSLNLPLILSEAFSAQNWIILSKSDECGNRFC